MKALLVVDIQRKFYWPDELPQNPSDIQRVGRAVTEIIRAARKSAVPIVFLDSSRWCMGNEVQYVFGEKCLSCSNEDGAVRFLEHRHDHQFEPVFFKNTSDGFTNPHLAPYLRSQDVTEVQLIGCYTNLCVKATARGAIKEKFDVTLIEDGVLPPFTNEAGMSAWLNNVQVDQSDANGQMVKIEKGRAKSNSYEYINP